MAARNAKPQRDPEATAYRRHAGRLTSVELLHPKEKERLVVAEPPWRRRARRAELEREWGAAEEKAQRDAEELVGEVEASVFELTAALESLAQCDVPELRGVIRTQLARLRAAHGELGRAREAVAGKDFGAAGAAVDESERELSQVGGQLVVAVNRALGQAAVGKQQRLELEEAVTHRRAARDEFDRLRGQGGREALRRAAVLRSLDAEGYRLAAGVLANQVRQVETAHTATVGRDNEMQVVPPQQCETFADVGGLEHVKQQLRDTIGDILERPDQAARYRVMHNGILFYGPPGTGKNLLSRALAGEYGLRYLRFSPAAIASAYIHEAAANLRRLFEVAKTNAPCVLYLDEIDTIASERADQPSADHREVVTQLMVCLEEYRTVPGLVICAGTNELDRLDPALREGRFDAKIHVPLPDAEDRANVLQVHLAHRGDTVEWDGLDLAGLARLTHGYNAAGLASVVSLAAQAALRSSALIDQATLARVIAERGGQHRITLEHRVDWDDVVIDEDARERIQQILTVFADPDLARQVGVTAPAGIVLHGPPGTGKTTIAKAMASQMAASFYEVSAADVMSKWAGESEQRVGKLFAKARANRPSIVFIDEIDSLLRRRSADTSSKWEERVLSQFLRELDGLTGSDGVLLVGATNRLDTLDDAIVGRRLIPVEIGLPDPPGRLALLRVICKDVSLAKDVDLRALAAATDGLSGADLKRLRDAAGMRALGRVRPARDGTTPRKRTISLTMADFEAALAGERGRTSLARV
ncbi:MAG: transitional endoplasmic reticulum ATPase [Frankiaceae bacterium]|nr:transitional endoplasmic reticulum ATPase [Frankiaceae bacterium]